MRRNTTRNLLIPALLAAAIAPMALTAVAFPGKSDGSWHEQHQERFEERRQAMFERAGLDEETRSALEEAHDEHYQAMRELHEQHRERMDEILDEEQREALREAKREMRQEMHGERRDERRQDMQERLTTLVDSWGLSDEERERLTELRESLYADMQELRDHQFDSREERREAWQSLHDEHREALGEVLTDEQLAVLEAFMQPRHAKGHGGHHSAPHRG
ncbi:hypothetical protein HNO52_15885 [Billgrantia diversa]|uniref:hypothetical protein n=1 Tax=Halomonas sp. MCCC 1A13316 TaxID=2733487 RepID=UPI0018A67E45|nr:hypothetical protein [Halomonas sp. MCCC 1A13316]QOR39831.1 hypothetical protein HNO52_15885 [Halomonas sp. MCCC 1A13316]